MTFGYIAGHEQWREAVFPEAEDHVDEDAGEWVVCPECGSEDAGFLYWGEGVDTSFECPDCGESYQVR